MQYSARILYQEITRSYDYRGSYETVKLFVRPLRAVRQQAERALTRFETPPGLQSQIDWGEARVYFGQRCVKQHLFVLTLGYSRRAFYAGYANEQLGTFLEAHEHAFEHFGGPLASTSMTARARYAGPPRAVASYGTPRSRPLPVTFASSRGCAGPIEPRPKARWKVA